MNSFSVNVMYNWCLIYCVFAFGAIDQDYPCHDELWEVTYCQKIVKIT